MTRAIVYDVVNLLLAAAQPTPRGIDRVDLAYARHFFTAWPGPCEALVPTAWGLRLFPRARVLAGLNRLERLWREDRAPEDDPEYARILAFLTGAPPPSPAPNRRPAWRALTGPARLLRATGLGIGRSAPRHAPHGAIYLNIGQLGWAAPFTTAWLTHRPDILPVFLLHDAIPIDHPEWVSPSGQRLHRQMTAVIARHAAGLIFTTRAAARSGLASLKLPPGRAPLVHIAPLSVAPAFLAPPPPDPALAAAPPYCVVCGAIEPRKNHALLLEAWRQLIRRQGPAAPRLLVIGAAGTMGAPILQAMREEAGLRAHMRIASGLGTQALLRLIRHARALLMPSLAEGFGLPVVEALALGTPVLAADIPALREAGGAACRYLPPDDAAQWADAVTALAHPPPPPPHTPITEAVHFAAIDEFLASLPPR